MRRFTRNRRYFMDVDIDQLTFNAQVGEACLFLHFTPSRGAPTYIRRINVSSRLQPQPQLFVKNQQELATIRREHKCAGSKMSRAEVGAREDRISRLQLALHAR